MASCATSVMLLLQCLWERVLSIQQVPLIHYSGLHEPCKICEGHQTNYMYVHALMQRAPLKFQPHALAALVIRKVLAIACLS